MATALISPPFDLIVGELGSGLSKLASVNTVHFLAGESALSVWVSLSDGEDQAARNDVYHFEDQISTRFPNVLFDFHIVAVPAGRKIEEFLTMPSPIFHRNDA